ncbi:MAG: filamentous hemagglutinin N-terminal domain-containing protein [Rhabdochlamydiaceae bacterium]|nr:filamentous hemagglutinin N-terminal domain-containing protein [Rhabdochlamydiaceae bacterium]
MSQLKKKSSLYFFASLTCFTWATSFCLALPSAPIAQSGTVKVEYPNSHTMVIKPSNDAILHYEDFQIGLGEEVRVIQKASSNVQQYVTGKNPSQILGALASNGKVVLINANGISLGSDSKVDTGSLTLSTLDMMDPSHFTLSAAKNSSIVNEGSLRSEKGSIVLLAPHIRNLGSIESSDVLLGSGEQATLDGSNFSMSGGLKEGLIEQLGDIKANTVSIKLPLDTKAIIERGEVHELVIEEQGVIAFGPASETWVQKLQVEGSKIFLKGSIDGTNSLDKGGEVHLFGKDISLEGSRIDVSGLIGGGEVLIGGEFQGKGTTPYASKVIMDELSEIYANGIENGDGGLVVLWSQEQTLFEGKIFAQGGLIEGSGGLVETSSKGVLAVDKGKVDTLASQGELGRWLLDPVKIYIKDSGSSISSCSCQDCASCNYNTSSCTIAASSFQNLKSNVIIYAMDGYIFYVDLNVTTDSTASSKASVEFHLCCVPQESSCFDTPEGGHFCPVGGFCAFFASNITTDGGSLIFGGKEKWTDVNLHISTNGGDINLGKVFCCYEKSPGRTVTLNAGNSGTITIDPSQANGYSWTYLAGLTVNNAAKVVSNSLIVNGPINIAAPLYLSPSGQINTSGVSPTGYDIALVSLDSTSLDTNSTAAIKAGTDGIVSFSGSIGAAPVGSYPINFQITNASSVLFSGATTSITSAGGPISITPSCKFTGSNIAINSQGGSIALTGSTTFSGSNPILTFNAGIGSINLPAFTSTLQSISITAGEVTLGGGVSALGDITLANSGAASISGAISSGGNFKSTGNGLFSCSSISAGGSIDFIGALSLGSSSKMTAQGGITIGAQINGNYDLILDASTNAISIAGDISNLHSFTITNASQFSLFSLTTSGGAISVTSPKVIQNVGSINSGGGSISFSGTISASDSNIGGNLIIYAGTGAISVQGLDSFGGISFTGGTVDLGSNLIASGIVSIENTGLLTVPLGTMNVGGFSQIGTGPVSLAGNIETTGSISFAGALTITGDTTLQGSKGITITGSINSSSIGPKMTLNSGASLNLPSLGSSSSPFGALSITASSLLLGGDVYSSSSVAISCPVTISANPTTIKGPSGISLSGAIMATSGAPNLTLDAGSGPLTISGIGSSAVPLGTLSLTGSPLTMNGVIATSGSINLASPITINGATTLQADVGIALSGTLSSIEGTPFDLTLTSSSGVISVVNLGTDAQALGSISITGTDLTATGDLISSGSVILTGAAITLGSKTSAVTNVDITNTGPLTIPSGSMSLTGDFTQKGAGAVSLAASIVTPGSISFEGALIILGTTTLQGSKGLILPSSIRPNSPNCDLTLNAGSNPLNIKSLGSVDFPFGVLTVTASTLDLGGGVYSSSSIKIDSPITISADSTIASAGVNGLTLTKPVTVAGGSVAPTLTLDATSAGSVDVNSLGSAAALLGAVSLTGKNVYLSGDIASNALVGIYGPVTIYRAVQLRGDLGITLDQNLAPNVDPVDLTLQASNGTVNVKDLGTDVSPLQNISIVSAGPIGSGKLICKGGIDLSGTTITLGSNVTASSYVKIANTDLLTISSGTLNLTEDFIQSGTGAVSLGASIATPGLISFTGALTISGTTTLKGDKGITITGSIAPQSGSPNLTLNSGNTPLKASFLGSEDIPFGSINITALTLDLMGDVYASSAIKISPPITISANTTLNSLKGTGGITLLKPVTAAVGSVAPTLTLYAAGGAADVNSLGSSDAPLGSVSLKGSSVFLTGNVISTGLLNVTGPIYLLNDNSISLTADTGITLDNSLVPNAGLCDLIMQSTGVIKTQDLGNSSYPLNDVSLTASSIQLQGTITAKSLEINCETCASGNCPPGTYTTCPSVSSEKQSR